MYTVLYEKRLLSDYTANRDVLLIEEGGLTI